MPSRLALLALIATWFLVATQGVEAGTAPVDSQPVIRLGGMSEKENELSVFGKGIYAELSRRTGLRFDIIDAPHQRTYKDMADGHLDGLAFRTRDVEHYPGFEKLIRIPIVLGSIDEAAYTLDSTAPCLDGWSDLPRVEGRFTTVRGYVSSQKHLDTLQLRSRAVLVDSVAQSIRLLSDGKVRYVLDVALLVENRLRTWPGSDRIRFAGIVSRDPVFLYLAPKFAHLEAKIVAGLEAMKQDSLSRKLLEIPASQSRRKDCSKTPMKEKPPLRHSGPDN